MPYADLQTHRLYYEDYDTPAPRGTICFLHGFTLDHRMWQADAEYFKQWYRVIVLDSKGHGLSDAPETGYSRDDRVEDLVKFLDIVGINKIHLVGLSMGGTTGIGFALKYPERLKSLTLVSTSAAGYDIGPKISKIDRLAREEGVETARQRWIDTSLMWYKDEQGTVREFLRQMMTEHSGAIWKDPRRGLYPKSNDLEQVHTISVRTFIMVGESDKIFLPLAITLKRLIPDSRLSIFAGIGHILNLEAPERFRSEIKLFLEA